MARPKAFDRSEVLDTAMEVFWTHGYEATTMTDLRLAMGLGRQSLYDTFGDKKQLFAEALARYVRANDEDVARLMAGEDALASIRAFLNARVGLLSGGVRRGCLMINTCVELSLHDAEVASQIGRGLATMQHGLETALRRAVEQGSISSEADAAQLAVFLTTQIAGMVVMGKNNVSKEQLQALVDHAMRSLR